MCGFKEALLGLALAACLTHSVNGRCTFTTTHQQYDPSGTAQPYTTVASCLAACSIDATCLGASHTLVDVDPFRCLFSASASPSTLAANSQFTFSVPQHNPPSCIKGTNATIPSPSPTPPPSTDCTGTVYVQLNSNANNGWAQPTLATLEQCKQQCLNDGNCTAFDWAPADGVSMCWFSNNQPVNQGTKPGITHYKITSRVCSQVTTSQWPGAFLKPSTSQDNTAETGHSTYEPRLLPIVAGSAAGGVLLITLIVVFFLLFLRERRMRIMASGSSVQRIQTIEFNMFEDENDAAPNEDIGEI